MKTTITEAENQETFGQGRNPYLVIIAGRHVDDSNGTGERQLTSPPLFLSSDCHLIQISVPGDVMLAAIDLLR
jgi:hypothetical protein